jgi:hypothetical protein
MTTIERTSLISGHGHRVNIDPYGLNPLAQDYRQVNPDTYGVALSKAGPPPKMFSQGTADLPAFTASGIDPQLLLKLPYTARHAAAAEPGLSAVHALFEQADPYLTLPHEGLDAAIGRVRDWASGRMDMSPELAQ